MKQVTINLYNASELQPEALERARIDYVNACPYPFEDDIRPDLKVIYNKCLLTRLCWEVDSVDYHVGFSMDEEVGAYTGGKAKRWIKVNFGDAQDMENASGSSIFYYVFLRPFIEFWSEPDARDISDLVDAGLNAVFAAYRDDVKYYESPEQFIEAAAANEYWYYSDGRFYVEHIEEEGQVKPEEPIQLSIAEALQLAEWHGNFWGRAVKIDLTAPAIKIGEVFYQSGKEAIESIKELNAIWIGGWMNQDNTIEKWAKIKGIALPE